MATLTQTMRDLMKAADLERGEINDVPYACLAGLARRGLIGDKAGWILSGRPQGQSPPAGGFPRYKGVKLTNAGIRIARSARGLSEKA